MKLLAAGIVTFACLAISAVNALTPEDEAQAKLFVASYSTTTMTTISSTTTTVPYQCYVTANGIKACAGRKLRRARRLSIDPSADDQGLAGSQDEQLYAQGAEKSDVTDPEGKFFFTVWKTSTTTATATATSTNRAITISASAYC